MAWADAQTEKLHPLLIHRSLGLKEATGRKHLLRVKVVGMLEVISVALHTRTKKTSRISR